MEQSYWSGWWQGICRCGSLPRGWKAAALSTALITPLKLCSAASRCRRCSDIPAWGSHSSPYPDGAELPVLSSLSSATLLCFFLPHLSSGTLGSSRHRLLVLRHCCSLVQAAHAFPAAASEKHLNRTERCGVPPLRSLKQHGCGPVHPALGVPGLGPGRP